MTRTSLSSQKVKGQGHQAALLSAALTRKAAAAVSVGTYSALESTATLCLLGDARGACKPTREERGGAYCVATRTACYKLFHSFNTNGRLKVDELQFAEEKHLRCEIRPILENHSLNYSSTTPSQLIPHNSTHIPPAVVKISLKIPRSGS